VNGGVAIDFYSCKGSISDILDRLGIIHTDPEIMSGSPVFVGTRVPLQTFFDYLEGESGLTEFLNSIYLENHSSFGFAGTPPRNEFQG
jgi:hypothetical protein